MQVLDINEYALVVLAAMYPPSYIPPVHQTLAEELQQCGLLQHSGDRWHATELGRALAAETLH